LAVGDVLVINGATGFSVRAGDASDLMFWTFSLRLDHLYPLFAGQEISMLETVTESLGSARLLAAALPLAKQCHRLIEDIPPQFNLDHRSQLLRVASLILSEEFKTAREQRNGNHGAEEHLLQIFEDLSAEELLTLSVGELAAKFHCSRRHLNRLFHQYFGFSVAALRMEMRLLKAVSILRDANTKVIHVAEQCGFNHLGLFNTCFKRRFGMSPGEWRKKASPLHDRNRRSEALQDVCPLHSKGLCPWSGEGEGGVALTPTASSLLQAAGARFALQASATSTAAEAKPLTRQSHNGGSVANHKV